MPRPHFFRFSRCFSALFVCFTLHTSSVLVPADASTLIWTPPQLNTAGQPLSGALRYRVYQREAGGAFESFAEVTETASIALSALPTGPVYELTATAVDESGRESAFAEAVTWMSQSPAPDLTPPPGSYTGSVRVALSVAVDGAHIHYTTDGSPATTQSTVYGGPWVLSSSTTVRAVSVLEGSAMSPEVVGTYTLEQDLSPPSVRMAWSVGDLERITLEFDEAVEVASAETGSSYALDPSVTILSAALDVSGQTVTLRTSPLTDGETYQLTVSGVADRAIPPNRMATPQILSFVAQASETLTFEAEAGLLEGTLGAVADPSASGGSYVRAADPNSGSLTLTFQAAGGRYTLWGRVACGAGDPGAHNSFGVVLDDGDPDVWDLFEESTDALPTGWRWEQMSLRCGGTYTQHLCRPAEFELTPGAHSLVLSGRETDTRLDQLVITSDPDWAPATTGTPPEGVVVYTLEDPPATPTLDQLSRVDRLSRDGITWYFAEPVPVGWFVNGDPYIVGSATVTAIDPAPGGGRHGSVLNPPPVKDKSGFDDRVEGARYDASLRASLPLVLSPGDSLVSSISVDVVGAAARVLRPTESTLSPVRSLSILTCLDAPAPPDAFRPAYCDRTHALYYSRVLDRGRLPRLADVAGAPSLAEFEALFRRPWYDLLEFQWDVPIEYMPDYSREVGRAVGMAGLLLTSDVPAEEKEALLVYLIQYGIDLYGAVQAGHPGWEAHGGHGNGRKFPIVLAGSMLLEPEMMSPPGSFGEDMQTLFGTGWTGATALYGGHRGTEWAMGSLFGPYEHLAPRDWLADASGNYLGETYRRCCTSISWVGQALAARLLGMTEAWNHPPFFAYVDRWMTEDDSAAVVAIQEQTGADYSAAWQRQGQAWDAYVEAMWAAHRESGTPPPPPPPPTEGIEYHWMEAEDAVLTDPMGIHADRAAAGGFYIASDTAEAGTVQFQVLVTGGSYRVWGRVRSPAPDPAAADSFYATTASAGEDVWDLYANDPAGPSTNWLWDAVSLRAGGDWTNNLENPATFPLPAGVHTLTLRCREAGTQLDCILLTTDVAYDLRGAAMRPDADGDGLPDAWESMRCAGSLSALPGDDPDEDGLTHRMEYIVGSDPMVPSSLPEVLFRREGGDLVVEMDVAAADGPGYEGLVRSAFVEARSRDAVWQAVPSAIPFAEGSRKGLRIPLTGTEDKGWFRMLLRLEEATE